MLASYSIRIIPCIEIWTKGLLNKRSLTRILLRIFGRSCIRRRKEISLLRSNFLWKVRKFKLCRKKFGDLRNYRNIPNRRTKTSSLQLCYKKVQKIVWKLKTIPNSETTSFKFSTKWKKTAKLSLLHSNMYKYIDTGFTIFFPTSKIGPSSVIISVFWVFHENKNKIQSAINIHPSFQNKMLFGQLRESF